MNRYLVIPLGLLLLAGACTRKNYYQGDSVELRFSEDTIHFDTVFTTIGTTTRELRVINPYKDWILIDRISLEGNEHSSFRLNVDGIASELHNNVEIGPGDSIFIFLDAIIDPNNDDSPISINAELEFSIDGASHGIPIIAWGQDINLVNGQVIGSSNWVEGKPYVIYNSMMIDTGEVLIVEEGTRILFHRNSTMYIAGSLEVNGSLEKPVMFWSDRLEDIYIDIPGQWSGLYFLNGSTGNHISNARIEMAESAIHLGNLGSADPPPDIKLENVVIQHNSVSGLSSIGASIDAYNCVISHNGYYCLFLTAGGSYRFTHCTIANQWEYSTRTTPAVLVSDFFDYDETRYLGSLLRADFENLVVYGTSTDELLVISDAGENLNVNFINCLVKTGSRDEMDMPSDSFVNCIINDDPLFLSWQEYNFRPDTLSPLINGGSREIGDSFPYDLDGNSRTADSNPDIGSYERQVTGTSGY
jgi:hypothetical protein